MNRFTCLFFLVLNAVFNGRSEVVGIKFGCWQAADGYFLLLYGRELCWQAADGYFLMLYGRELIAVIVAYHISLDPFL